MSQPNPTHHFLVTLPAWHQPLLPCHPVPSPVLTFLWSTHCYLKPPPHTHRHTLSLLSLPCECKQRAPHRLTPPTSDWSHAFSLIPGACSQGSEALQLAAKGLHCPSLKSPVFLTPRLAPLPLSRTQFPSPLWHPPAAQGPLWKPWLCEPWPGHPWSTPEEGGGGHCVLSDVPGTLDLH